ncbi:MAG: tetratricopeptide repeat protein, partial [Thermoplasmata archaeon]|nr:tetratricopeptide repeat protein [Thermoplasmata archaeon]
EAQRALAELLASSGKADESFEAYRSLVAAHPGNAVEARRALAAAKSAGRSELAGEFSRAVLAAEPSDVPAREELARSLSGSGRRDEALQVIDELLVQRPGEVSYLLEKRRLLESTNDPERTLPVFDELFRIDPTRYDVALERGNLYLARAFDRPEGSEERAQAARAALVSYERSSLGPELSSRSLLGIARASRVIADHQRAIGAYQEFLVQAGNDGRADVRKELGHVLREVGRLAEAEREYSKAVQTGLEDPDLFWGEVEVLSLLNQEPKALRFVDLLLQREPQSPLFLRRKGQLLLKSGRRPEGLAILRSAVENAHGDAHVHFEVAEALRAQGAYTDAITYFREGVKLDPKGAPGRLALAQTLLLAGQHNEGLPLVDQLLRDDPNDLGAWRARADACRALGRPSEVAYSLKAILLLDPHSAPALLEKARLHQSQGEKAEALDCLTQLLANGGPEADDPKLCLEHGDLASELGRTEEANRSFEKAASLDPSHLPEIVARRARLRLAGGRPDLALELLDASPAPSGAEATPRSVPTLVLRAEILCELERHGEAETTYREVLTKEPGSRVALVGVGRSLLGEGKHAEAKKFLGEVMPKVPPEAGLYLGLAEAECGLGSIPEAIAAIRAGVKVLPSSAALWDRLGELLIAKEQWAEASNAFAHAIALDRDNAQLHLRAGFVAQKLGHPNESLALYERATKVAPTNKHAWVSRGLSLISTGRPEEASQSFDRALALDGDFEPAKEGKKAALQKTREGNIEHFGREALLLEARLQRSVTKNDLFVTLHAPYELLEPVLSALSRNPRIDIDRLSEEELRDLESASYQLITAALEHRSERVERRGFALSDVALLSPPTVTLAQIQRLFGYLKAVLEADLRPENLKLTPDVEELARRALLLPENQRTLFQLVRTLRVGVFKARLIKVVEASGTAVHAPLPSLDLGAYTPEFGGAGAEDEEAYFTPVADGPNAAGPEGGELLASGPTGTVSSNPSAVRGPPSPPSSVPGVSGAVPGARCVGCGGIASIHHVCGAQVCQHCIAEFRTCPKCQQPVTTLNSRTFTPSHVGSHPGAHASSKGAPGHAPAHPSQRPANPRPTKPPAPRGKGPALSPSAPAHLSPASQRVRVLEKVVTHPEESEEPEASDTPDATGAAPARPRPPREKKDDEPRL